MEAKAKHFFEESIFLFPQVFLGFKRAGEYHGPTRLNSVLTCARDLEVMILDGRD